MANIVTKIQGLNERLKVDEFLGKGTVVVSQIKSQSPSLCAVPDSCSIHLDRRLTWGETEESAIAEIKKITDGTKAKISVPIYKGTGYTGKGYPMKQYYPTWKTPEEHPGLTAASEVYSKLFSKTPKIGKWTFSTNGIAIMGINNIPCIGFGPGNEEQAHAPNEWTPIEHLSKAAAFYAAIAHKMGGTK